MTLNDVSEDDSRLEIFIEVLLTIFEGRGLDNWTKVVHLVYCSYLADWLICIIGRMADVLSSESSSDNRNVRRTV